MSGTNPPTTLCLVLPPAEYQSAPQPGRNTQIIFYHRRRRRTMTTRRMRRSGIKVFRNLGATLKSYFIVF